MRQTPSSNSQLTVPASTPVCTAGCLSWTFVSGLCIEQSSSDEARLCNVKEGMRRLRNTKHELPWELKVEILCKYSHKLTVSGYNDKFQYKVISAVVLRYEWQCEQADSGGTPLHRPWSYEREARSVLIHISGPRMSLLTLFFITTLTFGHWIICLPAAFL